jgi:uncharacterized protein YecE (DUF72 family)
LKEYLIGTGGWAYFQIPKLHSLKAYSKAFNFVEVNSTFYEIPLLRRVEKWRNIVPEGFQFTVRAHKTITHANRLRPTRETLEIFGKIQKICGILEAKIIHLQTPPSLEMERASIKNLKDLISTVSPSKVRIALETRGIQPSKLPSELVETMQEHNMIHCIDLSKGEMPAYETDILYSRLFGRGHHNIYQPTDQELKEIDTKASNKSFKKAMLSFHFTKMYKDAARLKTYKQTGKFPAVTKSTGPTSLEQILREDAQFPAKKQELIQSQGWKLFDLTPEKRIHARDVLQRFPEKTYNNLDETIVAAESIMRRQL